MKIIDTRSGEEMTIGQSIRHGDGESVTLLEIDPGILSARARVRIVRRPDFLREDPRKPGSFRPAPLVTTDMWVPLVVRFTHPAFFLQHVAFLPS